MATDVHLEAPVVDTAATTIEVHAQPPAAEALAAPTTLELRVEPSGAIAERAIAVACSTGALARDHDAPLGRPAAAGTCASGEEALAHLVRSAALALDETDLHLTVHRR